MAVTKIAKNSFLEILSAGKVLWVVMLLLLVSITKGAEGNDGSGSLNPGSNPMLSLINGFDTNNRVDDKFSFVLQSESGVPAAVSVVSCAGGSASFTASAGSTYLWDYSVDGGTSWIPRSETTQIVTIPVVTNAMNGYIYRCLIDGVVTETFNLTVNPLPATSGIILGTTPVCKDHTGVLFSVPVISGATGYIWTYPSGAILTAGGNTDNITLDFYNSVSSGQLTVQGTNGCGVGPVSGPFNVTINPLPAVAGLINGPTTVCQGQSSVIYSVGAIANATSYNWTIPTGATIALGATTTSITVNFSNTAVSGNITVVGSNACGTGISSSIALIVNPLPSAAGTISGPSTICQGQSSVPYQVPTITNATGYNWSLPSGATIVSGSNSNSILVNFSGSAIPGNITVTGTNSCGGGVVSANFPIAIQAATGDPGSITGTQSVCQSQTGAIYQIPAIANATGYIWTLPSGASITSGSNTNSITATYSVTAVSGNVTVQGTGFCGAGAASLPLSVVVNSLPATSGTITGTSTVCQGQSGVSYSVNPISGATGYAWSLPAGASISSGSNTNNITVSFSGIATSGIISVTGTNSCGSGITSPNYSVAVNTVPIAAGIITGTSPVCQGQSGVSYAILPITGATGYTWSLPVGATIVSGSNTNSITVNFSAAAASGNISVFGINSCGNGTASSNFSVNVNNLPATAGVISGNQSVCQGETGIIYTVPVIANTTGYNWILPSGASIMAGANTNTISVSYSSSALSGNITVQGTGPCGNGTVSSPLSITVNPYPGVAGTVTGSATVCQGQSSVTYSVPSISGATGYAWSLPTGTAIISGNNTNNITVKYYGSRNRTMWKWNCIFTFINYS